MGETSKATAFFQQSTLEVAKQLIGCFLVVRMSNTVERLKISETEAYLGPEDEASHARFGRTDRSEIMWAQAGTLYVYLIYGMHNMLNVITRPEGEPGAVLIRGVEGLNGPGKLTKALEITKEKYNGKRLGKETGVWIEGRPDDFTSDEIKGLPRVGIDYASDEWQRKELRFSLLSET